MNTPARNAHLVLRAQRLAATSNLFEVGDLSDAPTDESFIRRINTLLARRDAASEKNTPVDLRDAISTKGALRNHAELVAFGRWLLLDGLPGMKNQSGKQADPRVILKCVAVAMSELRVRPALQEHNLAQAGRESRTREITKADLAERWSKLLGENKKSSFFDARLRSMMRILPAYLEHLESGAFVVDSKQIKKSPEIEKVLKAATGKNKTRPGAKSPAVTKPVTPVSAILSPFEIKLGYSSPAQEGEKVSDLLCMSDPVHASPKGSMHDHLERNPGRTAEGRGAP